MRLVATDLNDFTKLTQSMVIIVLLKVMMLVMTIMFTMTVMTAITFGCISDLSNAILQTVITSKRPTH